MVRVNYSQSHIFLLKILFEIRLKFFRGIFIQHDLVIFSGKIMNISCWRCLFLRFACKTTLTFFLWAIHKPCTLVQASCKYNELHGLWNREVQCRIHKASPIIPIQSRINPIPRIDTYFFKVDSNIVLQSTPRPPNRSLSCRITC